MVRIARKKYVIYPELVYVWTWVPDKYDYRTKYQYAPDSKYRTEKLLYKKHICGMGYYSRYHARRTITLQLGIDANYYIHFIRGKTLILKYGMATIPRTRAASIFFKGRAVPVRQYIYPAEIRHDKHRRRHFRVKMDRIFRKHGRKAFNKAYQYALFGYREEFSTKYRNQRITEIDNAILQEIWASDPNGERYFQSLEAKAKAKRRGYRPLPEEGTQNQVQG